MIAIIVNTSIFLLSIIVAIVVIRFIKVKNNGFKLLFILYTLFWIPLMLCRQYTGVMANAIANNNGGGGLKWYDYQLWMPLASYGFIGIFTRLFADYFTFLKRNRKSMIYLAIIIGMITFIPIIIVQNIATNIVQSLGVGVGASMIGTYQLMFNEQYNNDTSKHFLTISLLSIPPLIADFVSSSIQSIISSIDKIANTNIRNVHILSYLWIIGSAIFVITLILAYFVRENRSLLYCDNIHKQQIKTKNEWIYFVLICLLGSLIAFIKWANSGAIAQLHIETLANKNSNNSVNHAASYEGYLSLVFSFGQLIGGLITGLLLVKRIGKMGSFSIGCLIWIIYEIIGMYILNPYGYLGIHILNGFSYGIVYNLILGFVLQRSFKTNKFSPMGVYQSTMSIGIMFSSFFTALLKSGPLGVNDFNKYQQAAELINWIIVSAIIISWFVFSYTWLIERWKYKKMWF